MSNGLVRRVLPHARPHVLLLVRGCVAAIVLVGARLAFPLPLRGMMEIVFHRQGHSPVLQYVPSSGDPVVWLAGGFVLLAFVQGLAEAVQRVSFARFSGLTFRGARAAAIEQLYDDRATRGDEFERNRGDIVTRIVGDSARAKSGVKGLLVQFSRNGTFFVGVTVMLALADPALGMVFLATGVAIVLFATMGLRQSMAVSRRSRQKAGRLADRVERAVGHDGKKGLKRLRRRYGRGKSGGGHARAVRVQGFVLVGSHVALAVSTCAILLMGLARVQQGSMQPGTMFTIVVYLLMVHNPTVKLSRQVVRAGGVIASTERIAELLPAAPAAHAADSGGGDTGRPVATPGGVQPAEGPVSAPASGSASESGAEPDAGGAVASSSAFAPGSMAAARP